MKTEQTAVEFLYEFVQLKLTNEQQMQFEGLFAQAKQMEKEQMKEIMWDLTDVDMTKTNKGLIIDQMFKKYHQSKYGKDETSRN